MKFLSFFLFSWSALLAQTPCPAPLEKTAQSVRELVNQAPNKFKSMNEFLAALPDTMKSNFIFMGESRSFQTASKENPRVILTSPDADVRISFNTDPKDRGYNNIEISFWDPESKKFEYTELTFDPESQKPPQRHGDLACTTCHGNPPKPNWDTYNYWAGMIPFNKDTLVKGTAELGWYTDLLNKTKDTNPNNRLQYLKPIEDEAKIKESLDAQGYMMRLYLSENNGPQPGNAGGIATQLFDRLQERQRCAEAERLKKTPEFSQMKYLLAGMKNNCSSDELKNFVPTWYHKVAADYYSALKKNKKADATKSPDAHFLETNKFLRDDTLKKQLLIRKEKDARQRLFLQNQLGNKQLADKEIQTQIEKIGLNAIGIAPGQFNPNIGEDSDGLARMRYFLEPMGVLVSRLSTSIDSTTYSFADLFINDYISQEEQEIINQEIKEKGLNEKNPCEALAQLSREALAIKSFEEEVTKKVNAFCDERIFVDEKFQEIKNLSSNIIKINTQNAMADRCASCHAAQANNFLDYSVGGAPVIPFKNMAELEKLIKSPEGQLLGLAEKINDRINRPHQYPGAMPLEGIVELKNEEKAFLNMWIEKFISNDKDNNNKSQVANE